MKKKPLLVVVWLCLLGGLLYGITHFGDGSETKTNPSRLPSGPALDIKALASEWPQISAHAAAPPRGNPQARYTLAEFGDFQCPQCGKMRPQLEAFLTQNTAQANLIFVHRPLPFYKDGSELHKWAMPSARAAQAMASAGKFWPMYDALYSHQDDLEPGYYQEYASKLGVRTSQFLAAYNSPAVNRKINDSMAFSEKIGIVSTPTMLVHDNQTGKVWGYIGIDGTTSQSGIKALIAHPPWTQ